MTDQPQDRPDPTSAGPMPPSAPPTPPPPPLQWSAPTPSGSPATPAVAGWEAGQPGPAQSAPPSAPPGAPQPQPGHVPQPQAYVEQRPGIIPLRPLMIGDVYAGVLNAIRGNLAATLGLSLVVTLIFTLPGTGLGVLVARSTTLADLFNGSELVGAQESLAANMTGVFQSFGTFLLSAFLAFVIGRGAIGQRVTPSQTWTGTKGRLWSVLGGVVLTFLLLMVPAIVFVGGPIFLAIATSNEGWLILALGGLLGLLVCTVLLWVRLAFTSPAIVLEQVSPVAGIKRSWALSRDHFWRLFGIRLLAALGIAVIGSMLAFPIGLLTGGAGAAFEASAATMITGTVLVTALTNIIVGTLTAPFLAGLDALLYVDLRMRKEALDVQLMAAAAQPSR